MSRKRNCYSNLSNKLQSFFNRCKCSVIYNPDKVKEIVGDINCPIHSKSVWDKRVAATLKSIKEQEGEIRAEERERLAELCEEQGKLIGDCREGDTWYLVADCLRGNRSKEWVEYDA